MGHVASEEPGHDRGHTYNLKDQEGEIREEKRRRGNETQWSGIKCRLDSVIPVKGRPGMQRRRKGIKMGGHYFPLACESAHFLKCVRECVRDRTHISCVPVAWKELH